MNIANWISVFRIILIPFFVCTIVYYTPEKDYLRYVSLVIFSLAVISDGLDGYIARTRKLQTRLGSFLDPLADKLLLSASFITMAVTPEIPTAIRLPLWIAVIVVSRDLLLAMGSLLIYMLTGNLKIAPSYLGKLTTVFQMVTIISILLQLPFSFLIWDIAAFFTIASGIDYMYKGNKLLSNAGIN